MARQGRRAGEALAQDVTPGKVLALALLANVPIALGFVVTPLFARGDPEAALRFVPLILFATPIAAILSVGVYVRAKPERRRHRAARIGVLLAGVALALWAMVLAFTL